MSQKNEKATVSAKVDGFLTNNKKVFIGILIAVVVVVIGVICFELIASSAKEKNLAAVETISYNLVENLEDLEENEVKAPVAEALEALAKYTSKGGIVGVRANMLAAELNFQLGNTDAAIANWNAVASKGKKSYTAPIANFNKAVCYEKLNQIDEAEKAYKAAADSSDFILAARAQFNYGRILESKGNYAEAVAAYEDVNSNAAAWKNLAKTRIIALKAEGKAE